MPRGKKATGNSKSESKGKSKAKSKNKSKDKPKDEPKGDASASHTAGNSGYSDPKESTGYLGPGIKQMNPEEVLERLNLAQSLCVQKVTYFLLKQINGHDGNTFEEWFYNSQRGEPFYTKLFGKANSFEDWRDNDRSGHYIFNDIASKIPDE